MRVGSLFSTPAHSFVNRPGWREFQTVVAGLRREKRFAVHLNRDLGEPRAVEVLCHEWAHALAWNFSLDRLSKLRGLDPVVFDRASHDEAWGCAYSRVWRAYQEVIRQVA